MKILMMILPADSLCSFKLPWRPTSSSVFHGLCCGAKHVGIKTHGWFLSRATSFAFLVMFAGQDDKRGFLERVEACVRESQETVYENEEESSLRFTEPKPAHVCSNSSKLP